MFALRHFTVESLALFSGVKKETVYSVLNRHRDYYKEIDQKKTGKRGGQPKAFELNTNRASELERSLKELYRLLVPPAAEWFLTPEGLERDSLSLLAAEDILHRLVPEAKTAEEKEALLDSAARKLDAAETEIGALGGTGIASYQQARLQKDRIHLLMQKTFLDFPPELPQAEDLLVHLEALKSYSNELLAVEEILAQMRRSPKLKEGSGEVICMVDGIPGRKDKLSQRIQAALSAGIGEVRVVEATELSPDSVQVELGKPSGCVVTVDSRQKKKAQLAFQGAVKYCGVDPTKVIVVDTHQSPHLRNESVKTGACYFGQGLKMAPSALVSFIMQHLLVEAPRKGLPVDVKVGADAAIMVK